MKEEGSPAIKPSDKAPDGAPGARADTGKRVIEAVATDPGRRLDAWLRAHYPNVPGNLAQKLLRKGNVRVNGEKARPSQRLGLGDRIELPLAFSRASPRRPGPRARANPQLAELLQDCVCFEDQRYIFLNKPAGLSVHAGSRVRDDIQSLLPLAWPQCPDLKLAHRLDKGTSGCLVLAKDWDALQYFHELLRSRRVTKDYLAVLHLPADHDRQSGASSISIDRASLPAWRRQWSIDEPLAGHRGAEQGALSHISIESELGNADLARITIVTGRRHQIRRHMALARRPVVGDHRYGLSRRLERLLGLSSPRILLHSWRIAFGDRQIYRVECPPPADMAQWLEQRRPSGA